MQATNLRNKEATSGLQRPMVQRAGPACYQSGGITNLQLDSMSSQACSLTGFAKQHTRKDIFSLQSLNNITGHKQNTELCIIMKHCKAQNYATYIIYVYPWLLWSYLYTLHKYGTGSTSSNWPVSNLCTTDPPLHNLAPLVYMHGLNLFTSPISHVMWQPPLNRPSFF